MFTHLNTSRIVIAESDNFRLISYGNGSAYALLSTDPNVAKAVWVQDEDATKFRIDYDALDALPDATADLTLSRLWEEYVP